MICVGVLSLARVLLFYRLGDGSLHDWDEAIYAQVAKELAFSDTWMTLTWGGAPFLHKPPLYFWLTALTYKLIGVSEFSARLWPAIFGFGVVGLTFVLGVRLRSWGVGVVAALLLLVVDHSYYAHWWNFLSLSRVAMLDTGLTFWIMTALFVVWEADHRPQLIPLLGIAVGMAVMTKAWPGFFAAALACIYWLMARQGRRNDSPYWFLAVLLAGLLIVPWHLWQVAFHGYPFLHDYVGVNLTGRLFHAFEGNAGSPWNYIDILRQGFSIWGYVWPLAYLWGVWRAITRGDLGVKFLLIWITLPLLLFSMAQTKLGWYINMIYPAIALLLSLTLAELLTERYAMGLVAAVMLACCLQAPQPADGSQDVKQFALRAMPLIPGGEGVYVSEQVCTDHAWVFSSETSLNSIGNIRPALRFYMNRPLTCIEERAVVAGLHPRGAFVISEQIPWKRVGQRGQVIFEGHGFVLARWK
jgi:4-amino-4-deoxy-L-arabinose transferase-like glycosyltransferase